MLSSRNDWNYNAGMDESLNTHRGGGYLCGINNTPYSFTMLYIKRACEKISVNIDLL